MGVSVWLTNISGRPVFSSMPFPKSCEIRVRFFFVCRVLCAQRFHFFCYHFATLPPPPPKKTVVDTTHFVVQGCFFWNREAHAKIEVLTMVKFKLKSLPTLHALQGSLYSQPKTKLPYIYFDSPKNGYPLMIPALHWTSFYPLHLFDDGFLTFQQIGT